MDDLVLEPAHRKVVLDELEGQIGWLEKRCRQEAARLAWTTGRHRDWEDLYGPILDGFLARLDWFTKPAIVNLQAQVRNRLSWLLREQRSATFWSMAEIGERADEGSSAEERVGWRHELDDVVRQIEQVLAPNRRLAVLSAYFAHVVVERHITESAAHRKGGSVFPIRSAGAAWALYREAVCRQWRWMDDSQWNKRLAAVFCSERPVDDVPRGELANGVAKLRRLVLRGQQELRQHLRREANA